MICGTPSLFSRRFNIAFAVTFTFFTLVNAHEDGGSTSSDERKHRYEFFYLYFLLERVLQFFSIYGIQVVVVSVLSAITIYRRELSSNRDYIFTPERRDDVDGAFSLPKRTSDLELMLEFAGTFFVGGPLLACALELILDDSTLLNVRRWIPSSCSPRVSSNASSKETLSDRAFFHSFSSSYAPISGQKKKNNNDLLGNSSITSAVLNVEDTFKRRNPITDLPPDAQIQILCYLTSKDLTLLSCVSKSSNVLATEPLVWKNIFLRDYNFVLTKWPQAQRAFKRSHVTDGKTSCIESYLSSCLLKDRLDLKRLYFVFCETWVNWSIAGCNSGESVYVGIHNSIFDITNFIHEHPGSPETLQLYSGRDSTDFFEDVGHSLSARELASRRDLCVVHVGYDFYTNKERSVKRDSNYLLPRMRSKRRRKVVPNLRAVNVVLKKEEQTEREKAQQWKRKNENIKMFGDITVYYDAFSQKWEWWYLDQNWKPIFMSSV